MFSITNRYLVCVYIHTHTHTHTHTFYYGALSELSATALLTTPKLLTVWIIQTEENSPRDGNTRLSDLSPAKSVCRSRSNS